MKLYVVLSISSFHQRLYQSMIVNWDKPIEGHADVEELLLAICKIGDLKPKQVMIISMVKLPIK